MNLALALAATALATDPSPSLVYEYALLRGGEPATEFHVLDRTAMLYGPVAFRVRDPPPGAKLVQVQVRRPEVPLHGGHEVLCQSGVEPQSCSADFGKSIRRQALEFAVELAGEADEQRSTVTRLIETLDVHRDAASGAGSAAVLIERTGSAATPPDLVTRLVYLERRGQRTPAEAGCALAAEPRLDIGVAGIPGVRVVSVVAPRPEERKLIPLLLNLAVFCEPRNRGVVVWSERYPELVATMVEGLRRAAARGVDAQFLVVPYAASGRVFGPFAADEPQLRGLASFLTDLVPRDWCHPHGEAYASDFASVLHTLNDLYLREFPGIVLPILITDGQDNPPGLRTRYLSNLWPARSAALDGELTPAHVRRMLEMLDEGRSLYDEELGRLLAGVSQAVPTEAELLASLGTFDPGGMRSLQPHRIDRSPLLNVLLVRGQFPPLWQRLGEIDTFVTKEYGGQIWNLGDDGDGFGAVVEATDRQLRHAHVVTFEVPNPRQDGARHDLKIRLRDAAARRECATRYMPYYTSSRSVRRRLPDYLANPRKGLRVLAAYEARKWPDDPEVYAALLRQWEVEASADVRAVLFETWALVNLERLAGVRAEEAYRLLLSAGERAESLPDPEFARRVALLARWYVEDHPWKDPDTASPDPRH